MFKYIFFNGDVIMNKKIIKIIILTLLVVFLAFSIITSSKNYEMSLLSKKWEEFGYAYNDFPSEMELFDNGKGSVDGYGVTWKAKDGVLTIDTEEKSLRFTYSIEGYGSFDLRKNLLLYDSDGNKMMYIFFG